MLVQKSLWPRASGWVALAVGLALFLNGRLNWLDLLKDQPVVIRRYEGLYGQDYMRTTSRFLQVAP
jgi:hypothetical protein